METRAKLTYSDLEQLNDEGKRYELHEGEVFVTAAPGGRHQKVVSRLTRVLEDALEAKGLGMVYAGIDVRFSDDTVYCPDLLFVSFEKAPRVVDKFLPVAPDLAVEVLSSSTERRDRGLKLQQYARSGVPEYWIVDAGDKTIEVYALKGTGYELFGRFEGSQTLTSAQFTDLNVPLNNIWPEGRTR